MTELERQWAEFVLELGGKAPEAYVQIRKIFRDVLWEVSWKDFDGVSLGTENLGYSPGPSKMNQLRRNYLDVDEIARVRDSLKERVSKQQSSITGRFGNKEKDSRSQGFCMQTFTLSFIAKPEEGSHRFVVELYYRSTEVGQKFFADLMFLHEVVFPLLLDGLPEPDLIRFRFSTLYLSSMFLPIVFQVMDPAKFLEVVSTQDRKWFTRCVRMAIRKWMVEECGYNYRTRAKMHDLFRKYVHPELTPPQIRKIKRIIR